MKEVLVFSGTTEGRKIATYLEANRVGTTVCVATEYGKDVMGLNQGDLKVHVGPLDAAGILKKVEAFECIIDSTHPYAEIVSKNIKRACQKCGKPYLRLVRESIPFEGCVVVDTMADAVSYLKKKKGPILVTTGFKDLEAITALKDYENRCFVRVLPALNSLRKVNALGFKGKHVIAMEGPFSKEFNTLVLKETEAKFLITKDSGTVGGLKEKLEAAKALGVEVILIKRPDEKEGMSYEQLVDYLKTVFKIEEKPLKKTPYFPLYISLENKRIVVVGGGHIAERRIKKLGLFKSKIIVIAPEVTDGIKALCHEGQVIWIRKYYEKTDLEDALMVLALTDERSLNKKVGEDCLDLGIYVSVGDAKDEGSFYFPGIIHNEDLVIGITSSEGNQHQLVTEKMQSIKEGLGITDEKNSSRE